MPTIARRVAIRAIAASALSIAAGVSVCLGQGVPAPDAVSLRGAGSTFAAPLYKRWIEEYAVVRPSVSIAYEAVGSGEGVRRFLTDAVDFAGSDETLPDRDSAKAGGAIMVPATAGMIVITYNIPGVTSEIKLPRDVYVDILRAHPSLGRSADQSCQSRHRLSVARDRHCCAAGRQWHDGSVHASSRCGGPGVARARHARRQCHRLAKRDDPRPGQ